MNKYPMFTKRHYEFFADRLAERRMSTPTDDWVRALDRWCYFFKLDNPRFNEKLFRKAALFREGSNLDFNNDFDVLDI